MSLCGYEITSTATTSSVPSSSSSSSTCPTPKASGSVNLMIQHLTEVAIVGSTRYKAVLRRQGGRQLAISSSFTIAPTCQQLHPTGIRVDPTPQDLTPAPTRNDATPSIRPAKVPSNLPLRPSKRAPRRTKAPVIPPTESPTTTAPTLNPSILLPPPTSRRPTTMPTRSPTTTQPTAVAINVVIQTLTQARAVISKMVQANPRLTPEFIRMGFHDCVGGCDGCIDLSDSNNFGLEHPIRVLDPVVKQFATPNTGISRADIWALAAMVGADVAPHGELSQPVRFNMKWYGRVNCENANTVCRNNQGQVVACSSTAGPGRTMASLNFDTQQVLSFFQNEFGFTTRQTVAAMGAHSVGQVKKQESGIDGPNGWALHNDTLQNEYYNALMGSATAATPINQITSICPDWTRTFTNNAGTVFPHRNSWSLTVQRKPLVMLNSDIALVRNLMNGNNMDPTSGAVSCAFSKATANKGTPLCPISTSTISIVEEFAASNDVWLKEFSSVMDLILTNGYNRNSCPTGICPLNRNNK